MKGNEEQGDKFKLKNENQTIFLFSFGCCCFFFLSRAQIRHETPLAGGFDMLQYSLER